MTGHGPRLWGGPECTLNRIGDVWRDQTRLSGHHDRIDDLDRFAELGLEALRYPVLWERTETTQDVWDWTWPDLRLSRLRSLGMRPIVGLLHHGSGPAWTDLLDPGFAEGLARHAACTAERYSWVRDWTPVNEPLTTARFSALYGHWYPHRTDERDFWLALLNQIDATRLSMKAIRRVNPEARLVQTEDFGATYGTAPCASQVRFENDRRLMTWDLLCGRVTAGHPLFQRLASFGLGDRLAVLSEDPCPPNVIGMNYYVTSDRFLDHRLDRYTRMFERMLDHENIRVETGVDYRDIVDEVTFDRLIYTGPIDEFFDHCHGPLPYRSLRFQHETLDQEQFQSVATVNAPAEATPFTRVTEYKHLTGQVHPKTSVTYEYPTAEGDPYYPIPRAENQALFKRYEALAEGRSDVVFAGRLATYRYYNMDQVVGQALATYRKMDKSRRGGLGLATETAVTARV